MRRFLLILALTFATTLAATAQEKPPAWQSVVYTNGLSSALRATLQPDERGQTNSVQAVLNAISDLLGDGTAVGISVDTNGWLVLKPDTNNVQSTFDFIDDWLNITNAGAYLDPGLTNDVSLQAVIDAINEALAPEALTASQIGISTGGLGGLVQAGTTNPMSDTNTVQDVLDAMNDDDTEYVTQPELRSFIGAWSNQSFGAGFGVSHPVHGTLTNGPMRATASSLNTNLFEYQYDGTNFFGLSPRRDGMLVYMDFAADVSRTGLASPRYAQLGMQAYHKVSGGASNAWYNQVVWDDLTSKTAKRVNWSFMSGLSTAYWYRIYFEHDFDLATNAPTISALGWYGVVIGTTASPTP